MSPVGSAAHEVPHGTTVLAFRYADGVLVAGDRLATRGYRVASRDVQKVFETDDYSLMAIAGAAGPCHRDGAPAEASSSSTTRRSRASPSSSTARRTSSPR